MLSDEELLNWARRCQATGSWRRPPTTGPKHKWVCKGCGHAYYRNLSAVSGPKDYCCGRGDFDIRPISGGHDGYIGDTHKRQEVVRMRDVEGLSLEAVAKRVGVSRERVRQIYLSEMRNQKRRNALVAEEVKLDLALIDLPISSRLLSCLLNLNFSTVRDLMDWQSSCPDWEAQIRRTPNFGRGSFAELMALLGDIQLPREQARLSKAHSIRAPIEGDLAE